jgi:hypothetical protein
MSLEGYQISNVKGDQCRCQKVFTQATPLTFQHRIFWISLVALNHERTKIKETKELDGKLGEWRLRLVSKFLLTPFAKITCKALNLKTYYYPVSDLNKKRQMTDWMGQKILTLV